MNSTTINFNSADGLWSGKFNTVRPVTTAAGLLRELAEYDAGQAGLPVDETAGFDMINWMPKERAALVRTCGLGPRPEHNVLLLVSFYTPE